MVAHLLTHYLNQAVCVKCFFLLCSCLRWLVQTNYLERLPLSCRLLSETGKFLMFFSRGTFCHFCLKIRFGYAQIQSSGLFCSWIAFCIKIRFQIYHSFLLFDVLQSWGVFVSYNVEVWVIVVQLFVKLDQLGSLN